MIYTSFLPTAFAFRYKKFCTASADGNFLQTLTAGPAPLNDGHKTYLKKSEPCNGPGEYRDAEKTLDENKIIVPAFQ